MANSVNRNRSLCTPLRPPLRKAMVLLLVLIVVMMITLAGFSFTESMQTENKAAHLNGDQLQLDQAIASGVEFLKFFCEQPPSKQIEAGGMSNNLTLFHRIPLVPDDRAGKTPMNPLRFSIVAPNIVEGQADGIRCGVENESRRLHLADLLRWEQEQPGSGRLALMNFPGMTEAVADAILDWIDSDSQSRSQGAESDYYAGLDRPYAPRNGLPETLEELLLVKGVTRELLFGFDTNYNYQIDPEEIVKASSASGPASPSNEIVPWASLLTLYSGQRNWTSDGQPRIDLNSMDLVNLQSQLTEALDANWAAFIMAYRQYGPSTGPQAATPGPPPINPGIAPSFTIRSVLDLVGAQVAISNPLLSQTSGVYASPLANDPQAMNQQLPNLLDKTTVVNAPVLRGGVSVNDAPRAVLRCVPGIDDALADRILSARDSQSSKDEFGRRFPTWLLAEGVVDLPTMRTLLPNICSQGDVVRAQIVAQFDKPGPTARAEVVVDATTLPAQQVFYRDLRFWGLGFSHEWFGENGDRLLHSKR